MSVAGQSLDLHFLTFDACLSQTFLIEMAFSYNQDLRIPLVYGCSVMPVNQNTFCLKPKPFLGYILCYDIWPEKGKKSLSTCTSMSTLVLVAGNIEKYVFPTVKECIFVQS